MTTEFILRGKSAPIADENVRTMHFSPNLAAGDTVVVGTHAPDLRSYRVHSIVWCFGSPVDLGVHGEKYINLHVAYAMLDPLGD